MTKSPQNDPEMQAFQDAKLITWTSLCLQRWHNFFNRLYVPNPGLENSTPTEEQRVDRLGYNKGHSNVICSIILPQSTFVLSGRGPSSLEYGGTMYIITWVCNS